MEKDWTGIPQSLCRSKCGLWFSKIGIAGNCVEVQHLRRRPGPAESGSARSRELQVISVHVKV